MRTAILATIALITLLARPTICAEQFKDVPKDHWAAESVRVVKADGVFQGYPDATFKGNKSVTRYELAAALERMIAFVEQSLKPEADRKDSAVATSPQPSPQGEGATAPTALSRPQQGAVSKGDPAQALKAGGFIPANSPLLTNREKTVSPAELAQALSAVASRLIEKAIPAPKGE